MVNYLTTDTDLTAVADAIREKGGTSASLTFPTGFVDAIAAIPSGGGGNALLCDYDFTQGLVDSIAGYEVVFGSASDYVQNESGLSQVSVGGSTNWAKFGQFNLSGTYTIEVDVVEYDRKDTSHGRFLMMNGTEGFAYRSTGKWSFYSGGGWADTPITDYAYFNGHTLKLVIAETTKYVSIYRDNELITSTSKAWKGGEVFFGGPQGTHGFDITISGLRVYSRDTTTPTTAEALSTLLGGVDV